jgi:hypothetical protein
MSSFGGFVAGAIVSSITLDKKGWDDNVAAVSKSSKTLGDDITKHSKGWDTLGKTAAVAGVAMMAGFGFAAKGAADAAETTAKFGTIFEPVMNKANSALENLTQNYGLSYDGARTMLSGTGDLLTGLGVSSDAALDLSLKTQQLAVDLASFQNYAGGAAGASDALTKGMLGEREMLKGLGIVITEEMVKEQLLKDGKEKLTGMALYQARAYATLTLATLQSRNAVGDFHRTQESLVNQTRIMQARFTDLKNEIGAALLPIITKATTFFAGLFSQLAGFAKDHPKIVSAFTLTGAGLAGILVVGGGLLVLIPKLISGVEAITTAFHMSAIKIGVMTGGITLLVAAAAGAVALFLTYKDAEDKANAAADQFNETNIKLNNKLYELVKTGAMTVDEFYKLNDQFKGNSAEMAVFIKHGGAGIKAQEGLAKVGAEHNKVIEDQAKKIKDALVPAIDNVVSKEDKWAEFYKSLGIPTQKEWNEQVAFNEKGIKLLTAAFEAGLMSPEVYAQKMDGLNKNLWDLGRFTETALPPSRDLSDLMKYSPNFTEGAAFGYKTLDDAIEEAADKMGMSANTARLMTYELMRLKMAALGITMPDFRIPDDTKQELKQDTSDIGGYWDGLMNSVSTKWGTTIDDFIGGSASLETTWNRMWKNLRETAVTELGRVVTEWVVNGVKKMISGGADAAAGVGESMKGIGSAVSSAATTAGSVLGGLASSIGGIITTLASAIGTAIGSIAAGIGVAITTLATAIATAATTLAAAAPALLTVGAIAVAIYAGFSAINALLASGGGGAGDGMGRVVERQDRFLAIWESWAPDILAISVYCQSRLDRIVDQFDNMAGLISNVGNSIVSGLDKISSAISSIPAAAEGMIVSQPGLVSVGEKAPFEKEIIAPIKNFQDFAAGGGGLKKVLEGIGGSLKSAFTTAESGWKKTFEQAGGGMKKAVEQSGGSLKKAISDAGKKKQESESSGGGIKKAFSEGGGGSKKITPAKEIEGFGGSAKNGGKKGGGGGSVSIAPVINISALDGNSVRDISRKKIMPELIAMLKSNMSKTELREALGI